MKTIQDLSEADPHAFQSYGVLGPFSDGIGELRFLHVKDGQFMTRFDITASHTNNLGIPHGGFLCTLADNSMGACLRLSTGHRFVTVHLNIDFIGLARVGTVIEISTTLQKIGGRLCFVECLGTTGGEIVFSAKGLFKRIDAALDRGTPSTPSIS